MAARANRGLPALRALAAAIPTDHPDSELGRLEAAWLAPLRTRSAHTARAYADAVARAHDAIVQAGGLRALTPEAAADLYAQWLTIYAPATAALTCAALSSFWQFLERRHVPGLPPNPWPRIRRRAGRDTTAERLLTEAEVAALLAAARPHRDAVLYRFCYYTGARISEALGVRWEHFARGEEGQWYCTLYGKGSKTRTVAIRASLWAALATLPGWGEAGTRTQRVWPLTRQTAWVQLRRAARHAQLGSRRISPHVLRHCHATHALEHGATLPDIQAQLGHARLDTTAIYLTVRPGRRSEAVLPEL